MIYNKRFKQSKFKDINLKDKIRFFKILLSNKLSKKMKNSSQNKQILNLTNYITNINYILFLFLFISIFLVSINFVYSIELSFDNIDEIKYYELSQDNKINQNNLDNFKELVCQGYKRYIELYPKYSYLKNTCNETENSQIISYQRNIYYLRTNYIISNSLYLEFLKNLEKNTYQKLNLICQNDSIKITNKSESCDIISEIVSQLDKKETIEFSYEDLLLIYSNYIDFNYKDIKKVDILSRLKEEINQNKYLKKIYEYKNSQLLENDLYNIYDNSLTPYKEIEISNLDLRNYKKMENFVLIKDKTDVYEILQKTKIIKDQNQEYNFLLLKDFDFSFLKLNNYYFNPLLSPSVKYIGALEYSNLIQDYKTYIENVYQNYKIELFTKVDQIYKIKVNSNEQNSNEQNSNKLITNNKISNLELSFRFESTNQKSYYIYITDFKNHFKEEVFENVESKKAIIVKEDFLKDKEYYIFISDEELFENDSQIEFSTKKDKIEENSFVSTNVVLLEKIFSNSFELYKDEDSNLLEIKESTYFKEYIKIFASIFIFLFTLFILFVILKKKFSNKEKNKLVQKKDYKQKTNNNNSNNNNSNNNNSNNNNNNNNSNNNNNNNNNNQENKNQINNQSEQRKEQRKKKEKVKMFKNKNKKKENDNDSKNSSYSDIVSNSNNKNTNIKNKKNTKNDESVINKFKNKFKIKLFNKNELLEDQIYNSEEYDFNFSMKNNENKIDEEKQQSKKNKKIDFSNIDEIMDLDLKDLQEFRIEMLNVENKIIRTQEDIESINEFSVIIKQQIEKLKAIKLESTTEKSESITIKINELERIIQPQRRIRNKKLNDEKDNNFYKMRYINSNEESENKNEK